MESVIEQRKDYSTREQVSVVPIAEGVTTEHTSQVISVVNVHGDALGAVILLGDEAMTEMEETLVKTTAEFLGSILQE